MADHLGRRKGLEAADAALIVYNDSKEFFAVFVNIASQGSGMFSKAAVVHDLRDDLLGYGVIGFFVAALQSTDEEKVAASLHTLAVDEGRAEDFTIVNFIRKEKRAGYGCGGSIVESGSNKIASGVHNVESMM